jgi:hypothetical protein
MKGGKLFYASWVVAAVLLVVMLVSLAFLQTYRQLTTTDATVQVLATVLFLSFCYAIGAPIVLGVIRAQPKTA